MSASLILGSAGELGEGRIRRLWIAGGALLGLAGPVHAETLRAALDAAMRDSPSVRAAQARLAEAQAAVQVEAAAGRPILDLQIGAVPFVYDVRNDGVITVGTNGSLPLYDGGRVRAMVAAARARVTAAQAEVDKAEGDLLTAVATAFMDVLRDAAVLDLDRGTIDRLDKERLVTLKLRRGGEASLTDVHQSEARLDGARSRYWTDLGQLARSQAEFERLTGHEPDRLNAPDTLPPLAGDTALVGAAQEASPAVMAARARASAARFEIGAAIAERRPTVSLVVKATSGFGMSSEPADLIGFQRRFRPTVSTYLGVSLRLPLFGRLAGAAVRRSRAASDAADADVAVVQRQAAADTHINQGRMIAAAADQALSEAAADANRAALVGVRKERTIGQRTVLDVLNAEQELHDAEVRVATARSDAFTAAARTLNAAGQARRLLEVDASVTSAASAAPMLASTFDLGSLPNSRRAILDKVGPRLPYATTVMAQAPRLPYRSV